MSVREYVGARYVPLFADPLQWDSTKTYEPLTVVYHQGNSYTSRQSVPVGIDITNETYWALTGNYNAQIEQYRTEVQTFDSRIEANSDAIADFNTELGTYENKIDSLIPASAFNANNTIEDRFEAIETNGWVSTGRLANSSVTTAKLNDSSVTTAKLANSSVMTNKLADLSVTTDKLANSSVTTNKLANSSVTTDKLDSNLKDAYTKITQTKYLAIIGDSWSTGLSGGTNVKTWAPEVAAQLNLTHVSKAVGGSAWHTPPSGQSGSTTNFYAQLQQLNNDSNIPNNQIEKCIIYGGVNDYLWGYTNFSSYTQLINTFTAYAKTNFPNTKFFFVIGTTNINWLPYANLYRQICEYIKNLGFNAINAAGWLSRDKYWVGDGNHPNDLGYMQIRTYMYQVACGGYPIAAQQIYEASFNTGHGNLNLFRIVDTNNFTVHDYYDMSVTSALPYNSVINITSMFSGINNASYKALIPRIPMYRYNDNDYFTATHNDMAVIIDYGTTQYLVCNNARSGNIPVGTILRCDFSYPLVYIQ